MTKISFMAFDGEIPRMDQHYLPESNALEARNVKLTSGTLRPLREPLPVHTLEGGGRSQIYYYAGEWLSWFQDADAVPGPIAAARLYVTREVDQPQLYFGGNFVNLELPSPTARPAVSRTGTLDPALAETVLYAYTHVTQLGEETRPSPLSFQIERSPGTTITISGIPTMTELRGRTIVQNRLYRSVTTSSGLTELFLVRVLTPGISSVTDPFGTYSPQEAIASTDYDPVPINLRGLTAMPNGMMAGFAGRQIFFCEPYQPHAWPRKYSLTVNDNIIGLVTLGSTLMVLTNGTPYAIQGLHPEAMSMVKMEVNLPCISKQSIVDMGYSAIYASPLGLVNITESGAELMSRELWSKDHWNGLRPATIKAARWGEVYAFTHTPADEIRRMKLVNTRGDKPALVSCDARARTLYTHGPNSEMFLLSADGGEIQRFDAGPFMDMLWRSKRFRFPAPTSFGALRLERADVAETAVRSNAPIVLYQDEFAAYIENVIIGFGSTYAQVANIDDNLIRADGQYTTRIDLTGTELPEGWILDVYADGRLLHSYRAGAGDVLRTPPGEYRDWQFVIRGTDPILSLTVATTANEAA